MPKYSRLKCFLSSFCFDLEKILLIVWLGSLWTIGFIVMPILFATIADKALAGQVAGKLFTIVSYIGMLSALLILYLEVNHSGRFKINGRALLLMLMLLIIVVAEFVVQPQMAVLKQVDYLNDILLSEQFDRLHLISTVLYMLNSCLALFLISYCPAHLKCKK